LRLEKIGFIFQTHNLLLFLTSVENVVDFLELAGLSSADAYVRRLVFSTTCKSGHRKNAIPSQLSGG
jgi:putative ABC transport system ATP-binding protein